MSIRIRALQVAPDAPAPVAEEQRTVEPRYWFSAVTGAFGVWRPGNGTPRPDVRLTLRQARRLLDEFSPEGVLEQSKGGVKLSEVAARLGAPAPETDGWIGGIPVPTVVGTYQGKKIALAASFVAFVAAGLEGRPEREFVERPIDELDFGPA